MYFCQEEIKKEVNLKKILAKKTNYNKMFPENKVKLEDK